MNEPRNKRLLLWLPTCLGIRDCTFGLHFTFKYCASPPPQIGGAHRSNAFFCFCFFLGGGGAAPGRQKPWLRHRFPLFLLAIVHSHFSISFLFCHFIFLPPFLSLSWSLSWGSGERCKLPQGCKRNLCILSSKIATGQCFVIYIHAANGKSVGRHWEVGERRSPVFEK